MVEGNADALRVTELNTVARTSRTGGSCRLAAPSKSCITSTEFLPPPALTHLQYGMQAGSLRKPLPLSELLYKVLQDRPPL